MKKIYIVQVELPTMINGIVKFLTGYRYNHFSISFDDSLKELYSFQVRNMNTFLVGGFLKENECYYLHGKKDIQLKEFIYEIPVSDEEYERVFNFVKDVEHDNEYIFNYISSLFMFSFGGIKGYKAFHCTEFIAEIFLLIDGIKLPREPHLMRPKDLYSILKNYKFKEKVISSLNYEIPKKDMFFKKIKVLNALKKICYCVKESFCRVIFKRKSKHYDYRKVNFYDCDVK